jgi:glycosyltransferase involved in cell wall biosynthesis
VTERGAKASPAVSVCVITCNGAEFITDQLTSVLNQTPQPDELVVSDDASTDGTVEMVERITRGVAPSVRILRNSRRLGVSANLQQAIGATTGQLVLFSDQDDVWKPGRIARIAAEFATESNVGLVFSDAELMDRSGSPLPGSLWQRLRFGPGEQAEFNAGDALSALLRHNVATGATMGIGRGLLDEALPFPTVGWHDHWLALYAAATGAGIRALSDQLLRYRLHDANTAGLPSGSPQQWWREQATAWQRREAIVRMLDDLMGRLPCAPSDVRERVNLAATFLRHRQQLSRNPLVRARTVSHWVRAGAYDKFAAGFRSASLDVLLPQRPRLP